VKAARFIALKHFSGYKEKEVYNLQNYFRNVTIQTAITTNST
jgi:hypothetical protein